MARTAIVTAGVRRASFTDTGTGSGTRIVCLFIYVDLLVDFCTGLACSGGEAYGAVCAFATKPSRSSCALEYLTFRGGKMSQPFAAGFTKKCRQGDTHDRQSEEGHAKKNGICIQQDVIYPNAQDGGLCHQEVSLLASAFEMARRTAGQDRKCCCRRLPALCLSLHWLA